MIQKSFSLLLMPMLIGLSSCSAVEEAALNPVGSYLNLTRVTEVPRNQSITIVGSKLDESGNYMPSYPYVSANIHRIAHISPVPKSVYIRCESEYTQGNQRITKYATTSAEHPFEAGKTYIAYCNLKGGNQYKVNIKEAPEGTTYQTKRNKIHSNTTDKPTEHNRVRFQITGKATDVWYKIGWSWVNSSGYMSIRGWDGKFADNVELAAPVDRVIVKCLRRQEEIIVPLVGQFSAGKTYRLDCRHNDKNQMEAYVAEIIR